MKIGIVTPIRHDHTKRLLYFLMHHSLKPDYIILLENSYYSRIIRNLSVSGIIQFLGTFTSKDSHNISEPNHDFLKDFLNESNIEVPGFSLSEACHREHIPVFKTDSINSVEVIQFIKNQQTDLLINSGAGIFRKDVISSVNIGILNAHMGLLPDFRGMNVLEWSLYYRREIGVTLHFIDHGIDTGDTLLFKNIEIEKNDTIEKLRNKSGITDFKIILEGITGLKNGTILRKKQPTGTHSQYFVMHPRLKKIAEKNITTYYNN